MPTRQPGRHDVTRGHGARVDDDRVVGAKAVDEVGETLPDALLVVFEVVGLLAECLGKQVADILRIVGWNAVAQDATYARRALVRVREELAQRDGHLTVIRGVVRREARLDFVLAPSGNRGPSLLRNRGLVRGPVEGPLPSRKPEVEQALRVPRSRVRDVVRARVAAFDELKVVVDHGGGGSPTPVRLLHALEHLLAQQRDLEDVPFPGLSLDFVRELVVVDRKDTHERVSRSLDDVGVEAETLVVFLQEELPLNTHDCRFPL